MSQWGMANVWVSSRQFFIANNISPLDMPFAEPAHYYYMIPNQLLFIIDVQLILLLLFIRVFVIAATNLAVPHATTDGEVLCYQLSQCRSWVTFSMARETLTRTVAHLCVAIEQSHTLYRIVMCHESICIELGKRIDIERNPNRPNEW